MIAPLLKKIKQLLPIQWHYLAFLFVFINILTNTTFSQTTQTFTTTGSFTPPPGVTSIKVECWGGGGAGGGATGNPAAGGGGGGGSYVRNDAITVTPGTSYTVTVGLGATGSTAAGTAGGDSWFNSTTTILAKGGLGGALANNNNQTAAGASTLTTGNVGFTLPFSYYGGGGGTGGASGASGGGGGGSAGTGFIGNPGLGVNGGAAVPGGGAGVSGSITSGDGANNTNLGGGGAGGRAGGNTDRLGGSGGNGQIIITYTCPTYSLTSTIATAVCLGTASTITLSGSAANLPAGTYTVTYDLAAPNLATAAIATMTVSTAGTGTITIGPLANSGNTTITIKSLKSGGSNGCTTNLSANNTATVTINALPTLTANTGGATSVCVNGTTPAFTNSQSGGTWSIVAGTGTASITSGGVVTGLTPGTVSVKYTYTNGSSCTNSVSSLITVNALPTLVANTGGASAICVNSSTPAFTNAQTGGTWSIVAGTGTASVTTGGVVTGLTTGTVSVKYTFTNGSGCTSSVSSSLTVNSALATPAITYSSSSFCKNITTPQSVTLTGTTGGSYAASPSGLSIDVATGAINPSLSTSGNYTISYTVSSGGCSASSAPKSISIVSPGSYTLGYPTNPVCSSFSGTLTPSNTLTGAGTYSVRTLSGSGSLSINATTGVISPVSSSPGTYSVKFTSSNVGICTESDSVQVQINAGPVVTCPSNSTVCATSSQILLTQSNLPAGVTSTFSAPAGVTSNSGLYYFNPTAGTQNITATYTDLSTCSSTCNFTINVTGSAFTASATAVASFVYSGDSVKILLSSTVTGTQFTWTASSNNPSVIGWSSQATATTATSITQQIYNNSATIGQITYTITPSLSGCTGTPTTIVISSPSSTFCESPGTFQKGSCIIDMGVVPQTYANGLKPYGLVYQLLNVNNIPVYWAIRNDKSFGTNPLNKADSTDFIVDGINYKGGAFIIPAAYLSQAQAVINTWVSQGVVVRYSTKGFVPPVYSLLTRVPNAVLDVRYGSTIQAGFYARAGIPTSAYTLGGVPTNIANCDDIYVLPHSEPNLWQQSFKDSLLNFINNRGWLYSSCKAVSAMESNVGMNFLSSSGLLLDTQHNDGTPPYAYSLKSGVEAPKVASDPFMQSIGKLDDAVDWGAETIFLPKTSWRSTTKIAIYDSNFVNNGITYPNTAAILAYGRAFGNPSKGLIVYMAGHDLDHGVEAANVAAARIYGNFLLRAGVTARPIVNPVSIPLTANSGASIPMSVSIPASTSTIVSIEWTSDLNGIFSVQNATSTIFIPPAVDVQTVCTIQIKVTDACGRVGLYCTTILISPTITNNYIGVSQSICSGTAPAILIGTLPVAPNGGTLTYQWLSSTTSASTGFSAISGSNVQNYTPSALTQTTWFRRQVSANGISVSSTTIQVIINPGPAISTQPSTVGQTICTGNTFNALSVVTNAATVTYQWYTNTAANNTSGTLISGATNATYTPPSLPNVPYYYYCVLTGSNGCNTNSVVSGAMNAIGGFTITNPAATTQTGCLGAAVTPLVCTASVTTGMTYDWYYNTTASISGAILVPGGPYGSTYTPNMVGSYYYFCRVTAPDFACTPVVPRIKNSTFSGLITINPLPVASLTNNSNTTVLNCNTTSISLSASGSLVSGTVSYLWNNGLGSSSNAIVTAPGNDTVTVIGSNGCSIKTGVAITKDITLPTAGITNNYATNMLTCDTKSISVTATGGVNYQWSNGFGASSTVLLSPAGTYTVTVKGANGCTKDTSIVIMTSIVGSTWTAAGNNFYWDNPDNWCGSVPTDTTDVIITNTGGNDPVISNTMAKARNITIQPGANIYMDGQKLQLFGNLNASSNLDATFGDIELKGTVAQSISGSNFAGNRVKNLRISNSAGVTLTGTNDTLKLTGTLDFGKSNCTLYANGNLTVVSDAGNTGRIGDMTLNGLYSGNKITGNVTVERYIPNHTKAWQMLAIPTVGQTIKDGWQEGNLPLANSRPGYGTIITSNNGGSTAGANNLGFDIYTSTGGTLKYFNPTDSSWLGVTSTNTTPIANSKGYLILIRGDRSVTAYNQAPTATKLRTSGLLYQPIGNAPATTNVIADKYESVGNPYASAIDLTKLTRTGGIQDVYYIWDPKLTSSGTSAYGLGGYQTFIRNGSTYTVTPGGGSYANGNVNIESGQAFLVRAFGTPGTVTFAENQKTVGGAIVTRETNTISNLMARLSVVSNGTSILLDGAVTQFDDEFSNEIDEEDAIKLVSGSIENISVLNKGVKLVGDKRKSIINTDTVYYSLNSLRTQNYKLNFTPDLLTGIVSAKLIDNFLGTSTPLSLDTTSEISFVSTVNTASAASDRFYVVLESLGALPVNIKSITAVHNNDKTNTVYWNVENETNIEKYVVEKSLNGTAFNTLETALPKINNGGAANYNLVDLHPSEATNFYRVKAISVGGFVQYSKIVKLTSALPSSSILLYPNPVVEHKANLHFNNIEAGNYTVIVYNAKGQRLQMSHILTTFKTEEIALKLNGSFTAGDYEMQIISSNGKKYHQKFIIK